MQEIKTIKIFETFSGIGAQHKAINNILNQNKTNFFIKVEGISEWYIDAIIAYALIHYNIEFKNMRDNIQYTKKEILDKLNGCTFSKDSKVPYDINKLSEEKLKDLFCANFISKNYGSIVSLKAKNLPNDIDILTYSFPCQDLSLAGKRQGMSKGTNTRSGLLWEIKRILEEANVLNTLPKILLMENVTAIYNKNNKPDLIQYLEEIKELGYSSYCYYLNVKDCGIPQNRERAFVVSIIEDEPKIIFFDKKQSKKEFNINIKQEKNNVFNFLNLNENSSNILYKEEEEMSIPNMTPSRLEMLYGKNNGNYTSSCLKINKFTENVNCLTTKQDRIPNAGIFLYKEYFRFLTPRECFLLMGFENNDYNKINSFFKKESLYKFTGNSIGVNVLEVLFLKIINILKEMK